jgi:hypothetical protein
MIPDECTTCGEPINDLDPGDPGGMRIPRNIGPCPACGEHDARLCDCTAEGRTRLVATVTYHLERTNP